MSFNNIMNICFLEGDMSRRGGTERMTAFLANKFITTENVYVVSLNMINNDIFYNLDKRIAHNRNPKTKLVSKILWIRKFLKQNKIDVLVNVDIGIAFYGILASKGLKLKVITWEHSNFYNNWNSKIFPYLRKIAFKYSDTLVVLTEKDKKNYLNNIKAKTPIYVIANPIKQHDFFYDCNSKIILSAGGLIKIKRFDRVIEIAKNILFEYDDWKWVICGDGEERSALEKMINKAGLNEKVMLLGTIKNMEDQYKQASMFVLTSDIEGLPMVLLEAKSWGLPLISFDIMTGPSDIIRNNINGYLIDNYSTTEMTNKIINLIDNVEKRKIFSKNTVLDMEKFNEEYILKQWYLLIMEDKYNGGIN